MVAKSKGWIRFTFGTLASILHKWDDKLPGRDTVPGCLSLWGQQPLRVTAQNHYFIRNLKKVIFSSDHCFFIYWLEYCCKKKLLTDDLIILRSSSYKKGRINAQFIPFVCQLSTQWTNEVPNRIQSKLGFKYHYECKDLNMFDVF